MAKHQLLRAVGTGLVVLLTGLLIYEKPPTDILGALWQPGLQGALAMLTALGLGAAVKSPGRAR